MVPLRNSVILTFWSVYVTVCMHVLILHCNECSFPCKQHNAGVGWNDVFAVR